MTSDQTKNSLITLWDYDEKTDISTPTSIYTGPKLPKVRAEVVKHCRYCGCKYGEDQSTKNVACAIHDWEKSIEIVPDLRPESKIVRRILFKNEVVTKAVQDGFRDGWIIWTKTGRYFVSDQEARLSPNGRKIIETLKCFQKGQNE